MPLLNYTTTIDQDKSVAEVSKMLAKAGANAILHDYDDTGNITAISFRIKFERDSSKEISFRLPTDWRPVLEVLREQRRRNGRIKATEDQARRVAWRITKDWVEAQLAIVETRMVTTAQLFLPYAVTTDGNTLYENIANNPQLLIGGGQS